MRRKILCLSPHTDDYEFACGGSISKWLRHGDSIYGVSFSCGTADEKEFEEANKTLGVQEIELYRYPTRNFSSHRQLILEQLVSLERKVRPDLILIPSSSDTHQDHQVIRDEGFRAFKRHSLLGYEMPQNNLIFPTQMFVRLDEVDINHKIEALRKYISQSKRPYITEEFIKSLSSVRGMQAGCQYAEAFEVMRWME